ncbi:MAG: phosphatase PAP2 family protein [Sphingomonas fennica]
MADLPRGRIAAALLLLILAATVGLAAMAGALAGADRAGLLAMADGSVWLRLALTHAGDPATRIAAAVLAAAWLLFRRRGGDALRLAGAIGVGLIASSGLKELVGRPRPALLPHLDAVSSASFPSGHALNGTIVWLMLALLLPPPRRRGAAVAAAMLLAAAIGLSRVALAVHWPSDVVAGWAIGGAIVLIAAGAGPRPPCSPLRGERHDRR